MHRSMTSTLLLSLSLVAAAAATASAASLYVANTGIDSGSCGTKTDPCRSITQGVANASVGDTVVVGPGTYGNIDHDFTIGEAGEEVGGTVDFWDCMLVIDKPVTVVSSAGAFSTVIKMGPATAPDATVCLDAAGAVLGASGKGFTVEGPDTASPFSAVLVSEPSVGAVVTGNVTTCRDSNAYGILSMAQQAQILSNRAPGGCTVGISSSGDASVLKGNASDLNFTGFSVSGDGVIFDGNVAQGNFTGLSMYSDVAVSRSSFMGNAGAGVWVKLPGSGTGSVTTSNFLGNGNFSYPNCGVFDEAAGTTTFEGNWWGAASGPGADPADAKCNGTMPTTFADKPISVKLKGTR